ncbi:hypothetical protein BURKHO8Y_210499 [Burkholderia sp. 8Y]|nr:hypothetical protein BURKHO8Y_210499 [Burkholderia sp. 8Y]
MTRGRAAARGRICAHRRPMCRRMCGFTRRRRTRAAARKMPANAGSRTFGAVSHACQSDRSVRMTASRSSSFLVVPVLKTRCAAGPASGASTGYRQRQEAPWIISALLQSTASRFRSRRHPT